MHTEAPETIINALRSNDFETFYPYYSMKKCKRKYVEKYSLSDSKLAQTNWFKSAISKILV